MVILKKIVSMVILKFREWNLNFDFVFIFFLDTPLSVLCLCPSCHEGTAWSHVPFTMVCFTAMEQTDQ